MPKRLLRIHMIPILIIFTLKNMRCAELMSMPHNFRHLTATNKLWAGTESTKQTHNLHKTGKGSQNID